MHLEKHFAIDLPKYVYGTNYEEILLGCVFGCSDVIRGGWTDSPSSMLPIFKELIAAGLRIWVFR